MVYCRKNKKKGLLYASNCKSMVNGVSSPEGVQLPSSQAWPMSRQHIPPSAGRS